MQLVTTKVRKSERTGEDSVIYILGQGKFSEWGKCPQYIRTGEVSTLYHNGGNVHCIEGKDGISAIRAVHCTVQYCTVYQESGRCFIVV